MPRYALKIEYDGAPFHGWQRQTHLASVQGTIEAALAKLEPGAQAIAAAGRTDAGVHGLGQVAHCDMMKAWDPFRLSEALNYHLKPAPVQQGLRQGLKLRGKGRQRESPGGDLAHIAPR